MITLEHYMNRQIYLMRYEVEPDKLASYFNNNGYRQYVPTQGNTFNFILSNEMNGEKLSSFLLKALKNKRVVNICIVFPSSIGENVLQFLRDFFYRLFYTEKNKILENSQTPPPKSEGDTLTGGGEISADSTSTEINPPSNPIVEETQVDLTEAEKRALLPNAAGRDKEAIQAICNSVLNINALEVKKMSELIEQLKSTLNGISSADNGIDGCFVYKGKQFYMNETVGGSGAKYTRENVKEWIPFFGGELFQQKHSLIGDSLGELKKVILQSDMSYAYLYFLDEVVVGFLSSI